MPLTDSAIKAARPGAKPFKLFDERGLYLLVTPAGGRLWRFKFRIHGREKLLAFGPYPEITLRQARERREEARSAVANDIDPAARRRAAKAASATDFRGVAEAWLKLLNVSAASRARTEGRLQTWVYPRIGSTPISDVTAPDVLAALRCIEARGLHDTAHRARAEISRISRFAVAARLAPGDPTVALKGALAALKTENFAAIIDPGEVGALLRAIDGYPGQPGVQLALRLAPLVFVRPGELRGGEWREFDLAGASWRIPAARMKSRREHIVPLSKQSVKILRELEQHTGDGRLLFPQYRRPDRPISDGTLNAALRALGYESDRHTPHGFRAMASSLLHEAGFPSEVIELQLAHRDQNKTRAVYNRSARLQERRTMMQAYADLLDKLRAAK